VLFLQTTAGVECGWNYKYCKKCMKYLVLCWCFCRIRRVPAGAVCGWYYKYCIYIKVNYVFSFVLVFLQTTADVACGWSYARRTCGRPSTSWARKWSLPRPEGECERTESRARTHLTFKCGTHMYVVHPLLNKMQNYFAIDKKSLTLTKHELGKSRNLVVI